MRISQNLLVQSGFSLFKKETSRSFAIYRGFGVSIICDDNNNFLVDSLQHQYRQYCIRTYAELLETIREISISDTKQKIKDDFIDLVNKA